MDFIKGVPSSLSTTALKDTAKVSVAFVVVNHTTHWTSKLVVIGSTVEGACLFWALVACLLFD